MDIEGEWEKGREMERKREIGLEPEGAITMLALATMRFVQALH